MSKIFISYRREDSADHARRLYQHLSDHFGNDYVFFDREKIEPGVNYLEAINQALNSCDVLIVQIGPNWLKAADQAGRRRLDLKEDLVRFEIKTALDRKITVCPVLVDGARMPEERDLPRALKPLKYFQSVDEADVDASVERLIPVLKKVWAESHGKSTSTADSSETARLRSAAVDQLPEANARLGTARYLFAGHAIGAAAQFHRLGDVGNLNHVPAMASSAIPTTGGLAISSVSNYSYSVDYPRQRTLLALGSAHSLASGQRLEGRGETEVDTYVESVTVLDKLHVASVRVHFLSRLDDGSDAPTVISKENRIDGLRLGNVSVQVELDDEPLAYCGSTARLAEFYRRQNPEYRRRYHWRFGARDASSELASTGILRCSLIQNVRLAGPEGHLRDIAVDGNRIVWRGFGSIFLGEVTIDCRGPLVNMVRLAMGSDAEGFAIIGEANCNLRIGA